MVLLIAPQLAGRWYAERRLDKAAVESGTSMLPL
jgi:hypothetical protein